MRETVLRNHPQSTPDIAPAQEDAGSGTGSARLNDYRIFLLSKEEHREFSLLESPSACGALPAAAFIGI